MEEKKLAQVKEFRDQGLKRAEIAKKLNVSTASVDRMIKELKKRETEKGSQDEAVAEKILAQVREIVREEIQNTEIERRRFPIVLKNGKGEALAPESVYWQLVSEDGIDGERDFKALMKWAAAIELVQRMVNIRKGESEAIAKTFEPVLEMIDKSRQELDAAAARNRETMMEVASAAAGEAAARATMRIDERFNQMQERKKDIAEVQDPMKGLVARTMETIMNQITGQMFGGGQGGQQSLPPAWKDERQGGK